MAKKKTTSESSTTPANHRSELIKELWQAAVTLYGSIEPSNYKRYVLPIIVLRFLSLRFEQRRAELSELVKEPQSEYFTKNPKAAKAILIDSDEYLSEQVFMVPEKAQWSYLRKHAQADDIKVKLDDALEELEKTYPKKLRGLITIWCVLLPQLVLVPPHPQITPTFPFAQTSSTFTGSPGTISATPSAIR
jgi:type I restriction-modification system DNA methylase subunit